MAVSSTCIVEDRLNTKSSKDFEEIRHNAVVNEIQDKVSQDASCVVHVVAQCV